MDWGFWGTLAQKAAEGRAGYLRGQTAGEQLQFEREGALEQRKQRGEELELLRARNQRDAAAAALAEQVTRAQLERAKREANREGMLEGEGGRYFPDTEEGHAAWLQWQKQAEEASRSPAQQHQNRINAIREQSATRDYWADVAADLVDAHGANALNEAARTDRPELRAARESGELTPEMIRGEFNRRRAGRGGDPTRDPQTRAIHERYGEPTTDLEAQIVQALQQGSTPEEIVSYLRERFGDDAAMSASAYLFPDEF